MEALIPKLFIITAEASIVLFLILVFILIFNNRAKRRDMKAANEMVKEFINSKEERIRSIKSHLTAIAYSGNHDEQAEKLYDLEKGLMKEFVTLYLRRDTYRLLDYPEVIMESDDKFLKTSGSGGDEPTSEPELSKSEEHANAIIMAREQAESNEAHLKELSELRLKNTELNEHLFEALETITGLMSEHGKKTGQEVDSNAQKVLEAIIYLRDKRLGTGSDPSQMAPSPYDDHDQVDSSWAVDLGDNDATLDDSTAVNLGISDELDTDLDTLEDTTIAETTPQDDAIDLPQSATAASDSDADETDPWADALAEQAASEAQETETGEASEDPWADALAEQAASESSAGSDDEDEDPWAAALAEQAKSEKK